MGVGAKYEGTRGAEETIYGSADSAQLAPGFYNSTSTILFRIHYRMIMANRHDAVLHRRAAATCQRMQQT